MSHFCWLFVLWQDHLGDLCTVIRNKDVELARRWIKSEQWCKVIQLTVCKLQRVKWFPQYLFSFLLFSVPLFLFFFFFKFFFIEFSQPPERGSICWYWLVKFFLLVQQLFFLQYNFNKIGTKRLQYILFFCCFYKSKFHIVILFSLYKLIYLIRHLCLRLKYSLPSPLTRATRIRGGGHGWYVPFPQWCRLV